jgi:hypothetical protein
LHIRVGRAPGEAEERPVPRRGWCHVPRTSQLELGHGPSAR